MTVSILRRAALQRKLDRLPKLAKALIRSAMEEVADNIIATMKSLAPVLKSPDDRRRAGALRDSIGWTWGAAPKGATIIAAVKGKTGGDLTITIYAGSRDKALGKDDAFYARWVEFGTQKMPAQPFFYVSWRAHRRSARAAVGRAVAKAAKQVAGQS
ncbi:HK97 gp10 family phage protein [Sinorhizobium fredii]|uniref:HK97-gp10 family putative phage morphogenesis protein n=1 Tax=Rhizobium fredii TaxID=380 RepID=UPI0035186D4D